MTNKLGQLGRFCFLLCFLLSMGWPLAAAPGAAPILVREALEDRDSDGVPDLLDEPFTIRGVFISNLKLAEDGASVVAHLNDDSAGILLRARDKSLLTIGLERGDVVEAEGKLRRQNGKVEFEAERIRRVGHTGGPQPRPVTAAELLRGRYVGHLVRLRGQLRMPSDPAANKEDIQLRDASGSIHIHIRSRFFRDPDFTVQLQAAESLEVVGIVEQHARASAGAWEYAVRPRGEGDFHFVLPPSYELLAFGGVAGLVLLVMFHLYVRKRAAEKQTSEIASCSGNLQRSEVALQESNQKLSALVKSAPLAIVALDMQSKVQAWNPAAEQMFGWTEQEVSGREIPTVSQWVQPVYRTHAERASTDEVLLAKDVHAERKDGSSFIARISLSPLYDGDNLIHGCMAVIEDITVQKRAEEALRETNLKLSAILRSSPLAIVALDTHGNVQAWNPAAEQMFGWAEPEVLGQPLPVVPAARRSQFREDLKRLVAGEKLLVREGQPQRKDGSRFWAKIFLSPFHDATGRVSGSIAVLNDISVQKRAEEELRASEAKYRSLISNIPDVTWTSDANGNTAFISSNVETISGYTPEEISKSGDRFWFGRIHPEDEERVEQAYTNLFRKKEKFDVEYRWRGKDGTWIWLRDRAVATYEKDGVTYADGLFTDITERKQLRSQLLQAQKMEAIGRLAGGVAHDFNNLLNVISGYSELLLDHVKESDSLRRYAEEIRKAAYRGASLTRQLLAFSRKQVLEPKVLDLNEVIHETEKMLRRLIGEDIHLDTVLSPELGRVKADPGQIEQVLMNLAVNSRDAMMDGGRLTIETANVDLGKGSNRLGTDCSPGSYVMIAVTDTGGGMTAETRAHLFEPFFTTKPRGQGTGLGLATVYGIVKQSGGCIAVSSKPGEGAAFRIYLPRIETPAETTPHHEPETTATRGSGTILVVEDEPAVRELAREFLEASGYQVLEAGGGTAAIALLQQHTGVVELLLTDVIMPGMSGRELADRVTTLCPGLKVLYMSGYTDNEIARQGVLEEGTHLLQKPFTRSALAAKVRELLEGRVKS
ncbi:MAG: hypothetical protein A3H28_08100 [Acidobacteria bacterium RIFCSPLOWO2_02_FULL_61_28]|nr:MAG: hypothetical protein A3H28_08100 [Acidobacteria bacterium RIFCSPLOWO2_02_FULL_61_28]